MIPGVVTDTSQLEGKTLGTCTIQRLIGRGGMGAVYLAHQSRPRREVAVKLFMPGQLLDSRQHEEFLLRFRREADAIAALDHINIMPLYEYGEQDEPGPFAYLVMPYVIGGTLRERLEQHRILPLEEAVHIIEQAASALDYAHERGIIHRDLKPGNILFHADGRVLLADFGLAKILNDASDANDVNDANEFLEPAKEKQFGLTSIGTVIGTPEYFSPEQSTGNPIDRRTDVYSLGIVLYHMLSGHLPFSGATPVAIAVKHNTEEPPSLLLDNPMLPRSVEAVVMKAIAKKPEQRYNSAGEFARALRAAASSPVSETLPNYNRRDADLVSVTLMDNDTVSEIPAIMAQNVNNAPTMQDLPELHSLETIAATPTSPITPAIGPIHSSSDVTRVTAQPRVKKPDRKHSQWLRLMVGILALVILIGGFVGYLQLGGNHFSSNPTSSTGETRPGLTATARPVATSAPQLPAPQVAAGSLLYGTANPFCDAQGSLWTHSNNATSTCQQSGIELQNMGNGSLAGLYLNTLPGNKAIPQNYVLQVQVTPRPNSRGEFGVFFRNQPGAQLGTFSFLLDPTGLWKATIYDNGSGAASTLHADKTTIAINGTTTIDIVINGSSFTFYLNGVYQGDALSVMYPSGSLGLAADTGADVIFKNLAIYNLP